MTRILTTAMDLNAALHELPGVDLAAEVTAFMRSEHVQHLVLAAHPVRAFLGIRREALLDRVVRGYPSGSFNVVPLP